MGDRKVRTVWIEENVNKDSDIFHVVKCPEEIKGGAYRQVSKLQGLIDRSMNHWYKKFHGKVKSVPRFSNSSAFEFKHQNEQNEKALEIMSEEDANRIFPKPVKVEHENADDFFKYIDIDIQDRKVTALNKLITRLTNED